MLPTRIVSAHTPVDAELAEEIRERADRLTRYCERLQLCRVTVEHAPRRGREGVQYRAVIELVVPGRELVARRRHADVRSALLSAFDAARRRLEDWGRRQRRPHDAPAPATPG